MLSGTGTAGAYHAGALRALHEAGVKLDLVAGQGMGAAGAMFAAVDGGARLWDEEAVWRTKGAALLYRWRSTLRLALAAMAVALSAVVLPLALFLVAVLVYPVGFLLEIVGLRVGPGLVDGYTQFLQAAFGSGALPMVLPRVMLVALLVLLAVLSFGVVQAIRAHARRRERGSVWWRAFGAPVVASEAIDRFATGIWQLIRGTVVPRPSLAEVSASYTELLKENLGQPGFRELMLTAHDLDGRRDLVFALLAEPHRGSFFARREGPPSERRPSEIFDLGGLANEHVGDALSGALTVPVLAEPHLMTFAPDSYWRGETHRLCDRPEALSRLLEEVADAGAEQVVLVSATADRGGPHALDAGRRDPRGRLGEVVAAAEAVALWSATTTAAGRFRGVYVVRPKHNPVGPFDVAGCYDERSDRRHTVAELVERGYQDAYGQFIDPVIGAGGDRLQRRRRPKTRPARATEGPTP